MTQAPNTKQKISDLKEWLKEILIGFSDLAEVRAIFPRCEIDPIIL